MKISPTDTPWSEVSHNSAIKKQVFLTNGEIPHITQFARSVFQTGQVAAAHSHDDMWEVFLVTSGILTIIVDGIAHDLEAGASITLSPHETHELRNNNAEELHLTYFGIVDHPAD